MKIVIFQGGLGNQLFEYAFYKYVKKNIDKDVYAYVRRGNNHNGFELTKWFETDIQMTSGISFIIFKIREFLIYKGILKNPWLKEVDFSPSKEAMCYDGYWHDKKYFSNDLIRFKKLQLSDLNKEVLRMIENTDSVSVHIRRGDYLLPKYNKIYGGICTKEYYSNAINICKQKMPNPQFFVFSDDINWVKHNIDIPNANYVYWNKGTDSIFDMYLMSHCKCNIIANSTFSYWAAFINNLNHITIYPMRWINGCERPDIFPSDWIAI